MTSNRVHFIMFSVSVGKTGDSFVQERRGVLISQEQEEIIFSDLVCDNVTFIPVDPSITSLIWNRTTDKTHATIGVSRGIVIVGCKWKVYIDYLYRK